MKRILCGLFLVVWLAGVAWAAGVTHIIGRPDKPVRITWLVMNSVSNSIAYSNPNGKSEKADCTVVVTGTNEMSIWLQTSSDGAAFANAITTAMVINAANTDSFKWPGPIIGGDQWRLHTEDTDVDITNTVTIFCEVWR